MPIRKTMADSVHLRVVTYNIHRAKGLDGKNRLDRILQVLEEIDADIIALQEVFQYQAPVLREATGMNVIFSPTRRLVHGLYGNMCLSRLPLVAHQSYNLTCLPFEPRGCLRTDIDYGAGQLHLFNVHLGLRYRERIKQARMLAGIVDRNSLGGPRLLLGDFNEWFNGHASRLLRAEFGHPFGRRKRVRTHPSPFPVFPLDRIYYDPSMHIESVKVHRSRRARIASDHLPTYADIRIDSGSAANC
jgi:endonuclease/exonuclease/phosphatase family metal-dependent hydrolase